jgi:serine/threonine-protein kinase RsbT
MQDTLFSMEFDIVGRDFSRAGRASTTVKQVLKDLGVNSSVVRRAAICAYEAEMNVVMYAERGTMEFVISPERIHIKIEDSGPGIEDIELAMQEGYSTASEEIREMGFGAGMGLPNIKKNSDEFYISSDPGKGTKVWIVIHHCGSAAA